MIWRFLLLHDTRVPPWCERNHVRYFPAEFSDKLDDVERFESRFLFFVDAYSNICIKYLRD